MFLFLRSARMSIVERLPFFVWQVIKLDIDSADVELPFVRAIAADAELRALIGELHFEMHYTHR